MLSVSSHLHLNREAIIIAMMKIKNARFWFAKEADLKILIKKMEKSQPGNKSNQTYSVSN